MSFGFFKQYLLYNEYNRVNQTNNIITKRIKTLFTEERLV